MMKNETKIIIVKPPYIKLGQFLKLVGIIDRGSDAKSFLASNQILINGDVDTRRGKKLYHGDKVEFNKVVYEVQVDENQLPETN
jgi:ribosome-associated protein